MNARRASAAAIAAFALTLAQAAGAATTNESAEARAAFIERTIHCSQLALPLIEGETLPELTLAQRSIEREWGLSEDSVWVERVVPEWRDEALAAMMSAAVPGAGQTWVEGPKRGLWFALAEAAAWTARLVLQRSGQEAREDAAAFAGIPADSQATWSYARWTSAAVEGSTDPLVLYAADPEAFYDAIATDPRYLAGWAGDPYASRHEFAGLRATSDRRLQGARFSEQMLWVNHVVAAVDAIRAARTHNRKLPGGLGLSIRGSWSRGPGFTAVLKRRF